MSEPAERLSLVIPSVVCRHPQWPAIEEELTRSLIRADSLPADWSVRVADLLAGRQLVVDVPRTFGRWETELHRVADIVSASPGDRPVLWLVRGG